MAYQVIARKYRPQRFADVVGQEHVTQTLANAIQQGRIAHAYLFVGPRGTGKTTLARIFAKCLNATGGPNVNFAEDDPRPREIAEGRSLDVLEIDGASNRGIEEIRELRETVKYAPASSRFKIYIIDEVHMLTKEAFNALLKTLEEPPEHVKFMFATTEPEKVLPTILSRCQRFDLRRIPANLIVRHLAHIAKLENVEVEEAALHAIARGADGGMRDAESTLDQLISFCGSQIVESDVLSMFGLAARGQILELAGAIVSGDADTALRQLDSLGRNGKDLGRVLSDLLYHFRNLLLFHVSKGDLSLLEVSEAEAGALKAAAETTSVELVTRVMEVLATYEGRLRDATSRKILVEVGVMKAIQARNATDIDTVLRKLRELKSERGPAPEPSAARPAPAPTPAAAPAPKAKAIIEPARPPVVVSVRHPTADPDAAANVCPPPESSPAPSPSSAAAMPAIPVTPPIGSTGEGVDLEALWARVVDAVGRVSPFTRTYLIEAHPVSLVRNIFTIGFDPEFADKLGLVDNAKNRTIIQTKLHELGMGELHVKFVHAEAPPNRSKVAAPPEPVVAARVPSAPAAGAVGATASPGGPAEPRKEKPAPVSFSQEDFKNDPLIRQALEIFKGTIVEVRA